jgi:hypothetical protein
VYQLCVNKGKLWSVTATTSEKRWEKRKDLYGKQKLEKKKKSQLCVTPTTSEERWEKGTYRALIEPEKSLNRALIEP